MQPELEETRKTGSKLKDDTYNLIIMFKSMNVTTRRGEIEVAALTSGISINLIWAKLKEL